ncbi:MAG TPA: hypothetical protein VMS31_16170 [Pyrinomonadaceae bacterium]|nr:hypothetical protein [Pyrinomonadaceae bacterium]
MIGLGYEKVVIGHEADLLRNLKGQLEKHNKKTISDSEFEKVLNHLNRGTVFDRATILRDKMHLKRDDDSSTYIEFLDVANWCQEEGIKAENLQQIIADYLFTNQKPMPDVIIRMLERKPKVLERRPIIERITRKIRDFVEVFITGVGEY